jgi:hypothetical protein
LHSGLNNWWDTKPAASLERIAQAELRIFCDFSPLIAQTPGKSFKERLGEIGSMTRFPLQRM